jgi:hypothetical protein
MSKIDLYEGIKADLEGLTYTKGDSTVGQVQTVALWRNQIEREPEEIPFLYPAIFIEFLTSNYMESSSKAYQSLELTVRLHICFESYKDEDLDVLRLTQAVYSAMQLKNYAGTTGFFAAMKRRNEEQNFDHPNVQDFIQDYSVGTAKDFYKDQRPTVDATVNTLTITPEVVTEI